MFSDSAFNAVSYVARFLISRLAPFQYVDISTYIQEEGRRVSLGILPNLLALENKTQLSKVSGIFI